LDQGPCAWRSPSINDDRADTRKNAMPFDGFCLPGSPLARLLEADRLLTQERRAAVLLRRKPRTPGEAQARRVAQARASIVALDLLVELFAGGENWIQGDFEDDGGYCLVGGLRHIRTGLKSRDRAGLYLSQAIARTTGARQSLINFNDGNNGSRRTYPDIRLVIRCARKLARRAADGKTA
jgi:hypothetical protein